MAAYRMKPDPFPDLVDMHENLDATRVSGFSMSDTTIQTLLNTIIRDTRNKSWSLAVSGGKHSTLILGIS
jgi:hypothetical protein